MKLTVMERFQALNLLPEEGNISTMRMRQKLIEKLGLTSEELEEYEVGAGEQPGMIKWRLDLPQEKEINLKGPEIAAIAENLRRLDKSENLTPAHLTLYDKFVSDEED